MSATWKAYFYFLLLYEIGRAIYALTLSVPFLVLLQLPYAVLMVALFGLAFERGILRQGIWKYAFALGLLLYAQAWLLNPLLYSYRAHASLMTIARIQLLAVPLLPLIAAVFIYAWKREALWSATRPPANPQATRLPAFNRIRASAYAFACFILLLQPAFASNSAHFGWGFLPMLASIYVLPLFAIGLFADTCVTTIDICKSPRTGTPWRFRVPLIAAALLLAYIIVFALFLSGR